MAVHCRADYVAFQTELHIQRNDVQSIHQRRASVLVTVSLYIMALNSK